MAGLGASTVIPDSRQTDTSTPGRVDPDKLEIIETSGTLRNLWLDRAIEQNSVQLVGQAISDDSYTFYRDDAEVLYTRGPAIDDPFYTVYLHGEHDTDSANTTGLVVWSQNEEIDTTSIGIAHVDHDGDGQGDQYRVNQYNLMGKSMAVRSEAVENFGGCEDVYWPCVAEITASYAAMCGSCALCASSLTPPTCAVCLGAVGFHLASQHCP